MPFALPVPFNFHIIKGVDQTNGSDHRSLAGENSTYAIDLVLLCGWTSRVRMKRSGDVTEHFRRYSNELLLLSDASLVNTFI